MMTSALQLFRWCSLALCFYYKL